MTQRQIEYFIKTCELGNMATAAEALYVSRSAISYAISELENEFNTELLTRSNTGVEPTQAGRLLYEMLVRQDQEYRRLVKQFGKLRVKGRVEPLRIAVSLTNTAEVIPVLFDGFMMSHPEIPISVSVLMAEDIPKLISEGQFDVAITPSKLDGYPGLEHRELFRAATQIIVSQNNPFADKTSLSSDEVCSLPFAFLGEPPRIIRDLISGYEARTGQKIRVVATVNDWSIIKTLVQNDYAAASAPTNISRTWKGVVSIPVQGLDAEAVHQIIWNKNDVLSPQMNEFIKYICGSW